MELRPEDIQTILRVFAESPIEELRLEIGDTRLHVSKRSGALPPAEAAPASSAPAANAVQPLAVVPQPRAAASPAAARTAQPAQPPPASGAAANPAGAPGRADHGAAPVSPADGRLYELRAPLLGVFYRRPSPTEPPFVEVGSVVTPKDPVCLIDVMKMFTRVEAGVAGRIVEICVQDGQLVEYGQVLMRIEPDATSSGSAVEGAT